MKFFSVKYFPYFVQTSNSFNGVKDSLLDNPAIFYFNPERNSLDIFIKHKMEEFVSSR